MPKKEEKEQKNKETEELKNEKVENSEEAVKEEKKTTAKKETKTAKATAEKKSKKEKVKLPKEERKHSKKYREVAALVNKNNYYSLAEAIELTKKTSTTKFDSSVEIHIRLGVNPTAADQQVRGTVALPYGTGKTKRIAVICSTDKEKEAKDAGADKVGADTLIAEIEKGKIDFDILVASPDMMAQIGKLGKVLGTKGLMPNPKAGTVTPEVGKAVKELKAGRVEFKVDKDAIVHQTIGKVSFDAKKLEENYNVFMDAIKHAKPSGAKGTYMRSVNLSTTMGPGIKIEF
jgi:large subunit ribosomal protein L1